MENSDNQNPVTTGMSFQNRRHFLKLAGITAMSVPFAGFADFKVHGVALVVNPADQVAATAAVQWAISELETVLKAKGINVKRFTQVNEATAGDLCIVATGSDTEFAQSILKKTKVTMAAVSEALGLVPAVDGLKPILLATGYDVRGLIYALLELTDRVDCAASPLTAMQITRPIVEQPLNKVRSINRLFVSEIEDKPWFNDREMWPKYLTMLATQRFNLFNFTLGISYDFLQNVTDAYLQFAYPFLITVPGYNVRVPELPDAERDQNLQMLKFISEQTVARGIDFCLGLWMHGYEWLNSPHPNYTITGLTKETHAPYCRDAVRALLQACPAISTITFRIHGESGVTEGSYDFWKTVFDGVQTCGRRVGINLHAKGLDQQMLDNAMATGVPISVSPKYWAEHMGMPYHQADIRALEVPQPNKRVSGLMNLSEGSRSFIRYGYGDLLKEDRKYEVIHRIWSGTQRFLLWGDPVTGAAQSRAFSFCGTNGVDLMDPLSFKGRRGSGIAGDRCAYEDVSLRPRWDWEKYLYSLRVFGRTLYNPDTSPDVWHRFLFKQFGPGAEAVQQALAYATRILPTVLTAHGASAGNNTYWPEMYTNMSIVAVIRSPYGDTPSPKVFGAVSPTDPQLFLTINNFAEELLSGKRSGKYTPVEVAQWLYADADMVDKELQQASAKATRKTSPEYRRMWVDVTMQAGLGRFFAAKFCAGVLYAIYGKSGDRTALAEALNCYREAREHWSKLANVAKGVYMKDVTAGESSWLRGHWLDRLPAIDEDITRMSKKLDEAPAVQTRQPAAIAAIKLCLTKPQRAGVKCRHQQPEKFTKGNTIILDITFEQAPALVKLYYRHVDHAERYEVIDMVVNGSTCQAGIPSGYTQSPYPLQYYFEVFESGGAVALYPGFNATRDNQPYFIIRQV